MRKAKYICVEGSEGTGKGTQSRILADYLISKGFKVLETKEPGTPHLPITMDLRKLMLDSLYESNPEELAVDLESLLPRIQELTETAICNLHLAKEEVKNNGKITLPARELISQAIRSIHIEKLIMPALEEYDYIIQDRGILSGLAYGVACGNSLGFVQSLSERSLGEASLNDIYDQVILFEGNVSKGLDRALNAKQEFKDGDAMENKGVSFLEQVALNFSQFSSLFKKVTVINIDGKSIKKVSEELFKELV